MFLLFVAIRKDVYAAWLKWSILCEQQVVGMEAIEGEDERTGATKERGTRVAAYVRTRSGRRGTRFAQTS